MLSWLSVISYFSTPLSQLHCAALKGVGPKITHSLKRLGIITVQDLLFHLPLRYEDRTYFKPLNSLQPGDQVQVTGEIAYTVLKEGRRKSLIVKIKDASGFLSLRFFYFTSAQAQKLSEAGQRIHCYGEVKYGLNGYEMIHPEYTLLEEGKAFALENTLTAVYPSTDGLHQYTIRKLINLALQLLNNGSGLKELLPQSVLNEFNLPPLREALQYVHCPPKTAPLPLLQQGLHPMRQRLVFEELLAHQLSLAKFRCKIKDLTAPRIMQKGKLVAAFLDRLPYPLTQSQQKVIKEIASDLNEAPMLRLLQGDVGSGKTVVAVCAALPVIESGYQVAIMAPTELLAEQHYRNFETWLATLDIRIVLLTSATRGKWREENKEKIAKGELQIVVGTHALFQKDIHFYKLGLIIIDEQHRFGVHQRLELLSKGILLNSHPHQLIMSATPIPRTLAMIAYADLDCSIIDELPPGRMPVKTIVLPNARRAELINRIREKCLKGTQAYWVCTLIEESEALTCRAAEDIFQELTMHLPELRIGLVHGRMKSREKENNMIAFKDKQIDLLVATTVIEVGVDVPNASLMVIENAERYGLAQLHQLRGRVGRGSLQSYCILLYQEPLSRLAKERLKVVRDNLDGFAIAQKDLELRGPGEVLGTRQTGLVQFKIANLTMDYPQLPLIQKAAKKLLAQFPEQADYLIKRWLSDNACFLEV
jgi:ATP-dependent DNA helicase RecG